jgi:hypothetical protein
MRKLILTFALFVPLLGCQHPTDTGRTAARSAADAPPGTGSVAPGSPPTGVATPTPAPPGELSPADAVSRHSAAPTWRAVVVPAGTQLTIQLEDSVASDTSHPEQPVRAELVHRVVVRGTTALAAGSTLEGTVTTAKRSGRVRGRAELGIRFDTVEPKDADSRYRVRTGIVTRRAPGTGKKDALTIVGPAAGGAILGGIFGGKKGALIGTTVGGGAGTAVVLTTRGKEVRLPRGSRLVIKLMEPLTVRVRA